MIRVWFVRFKKLYALLPPLIVRDIKERYAGSAAGILWTVMQPVMTILLFWLVFSQILRIRIHVDIGEIPFLPFLLSGLLPWFAIQEGITRGASSIVDKGYIIKKVFYPAELFPLSAVLSSLVHHGIGFVVFLVVFFALSGGIAFFQAPFIIALLLMQIVMTAGLAFFLSALSVYIRDILQVLGLVFQALFYMTTILFPMQQVPAGLKPVILLNPFTWLMEAYHSVILYGRYPDPISMAYLFFLSFGVFAGGLYVFKKLKKGFADVL
jgi:lipopolysaccharide transport system permease protein